MFERFITTELTTLDASGQPITWPVTPYYTSGAPSIDVTTGLGYPKKAYDAQRNPKVSLLFSDPTGSGMETPPMVLVQGTAEVDDRDLSANADRYARESSQKLPAYDALQPPALFRRFFTWYYSRIYVHVRPERVYTWADGNAEAEPVLLDSHMEEVRSGHDEEPDVAHIEPSGGEAVWDERVDDLGREFQDGVVSFVAPDGFPFSMRVPVEVDAQQKLLRIGCDPTGAPLQPGVACLVVHRHDERFSWQRNFQIRGDLVRAGDCWALAPRKLVGGFELPPGSQLARIQMNYAKVRRFRRRAKQELARRGG